MSTRRTFLRQSVAGVAGVWTLAELSGIACAQDAGSKPLKVCFVSGSGEYKSDESLASFQKYLAEGKHPIEVSWAKWKGETDLPGLEALETCDTAILFTRRLKIEGDQLERLKKYCQSGKPIVGVRTASHGVQSYLEFDREVLGGNYKGHYGDGPQIKLAFTAKAAAHPVFAGVKEFPPGGSLYKNTGVLEDVEVLANGSIDKPEATEPVAWTRVHKGGRVFYTSLGHPKDFEDENFRKLLTNALYWSAGRTPK
jgi:type 1 glutamine amidotransferase